MHQHDLSRFQHSHIFHYTGDRAERNTMRVVLLTVTMMFIEIIAGWRFHSMALLADGWHMSTHAAALGLSWFAFFLSRRLAGDTRFAFGTWKIEILGGFVSAILLGLVAVAMLWISVERLWHPVAIQFNQAIFVAVAGLGVNVLSILLLGAHGGEHRHAHMPADETHKNLNLRAAYLHVVADALTSVLAIVALLGGKYMHWNWLDPLIGIVGAVMIARWTKALLLETGAILLDCETDASLKDEIKAALETGHDIRISDLHVWPVGQDKFACIIALMAKEPLPLHEYKERLRSVHELAHLTIEIERCTS
ncbi:MAG: cation transporter [Verrucomicrobia bacterium]|nr:MAG: cation transporter [Verrucomicrobiota bacterium]